METMRKYDYYILFDDGNEPMLITKDYDAICNYVIDNALIECVKERECNLYGGKWNNEKMDIKYIQQDLIDDLMLG